tara:strand:+ start:528 stop:674 length:147 start_codon:yes stop_codon:yes gene_type:complete
MNKKVIELLARQQVQWEAKFGRKISFEEAEIHQIAKLSRLQQEDKSKH